MLCKSFYKLLVYFRHRKSRCASPIMDFSKDEAEKSAGLKALSISDQFETAPTNESGQGEVKPKTHFSLLGAIGIQYSLTSAPLAIGFYLSMVIGLGGSPAYFWGFILMGFFQVFVYLAVCELASAIPHSAGSSSIITIRWPCI